MRRILVSLARPAVRVRRSVPRVAESRGATPAVRHRQRGRRRADERARRRRTGAPAKDGQTIVIRGEKIAAVGPASRRADSPAARARSILRARRDSGIIGLHDHMYYGGMKFMGHSYPRLFLSAA